MKNYKEGSDDYKRVNGELAEARKAEAGLKKAYDDAKAEHDTLKVKIAEDNYYNAKMEEHAAYDNWKHADESLRNHEGYGITEDSVTKEVKKAKAKME